MIFENIQGSLLAGAVGDSLGAAVEIFRLDEILAKTGAAGVSELLPYDPGDYLKWAPCEQTGIGVITDDTCMSAAVTAGLLVSYEDKRAKGHDNTAYFLHQAFLKWGRHQAWAQGDYPARLDTKIRWPEWFDGFCFSSGAGKNTLAALNSGQIGTLENPLSIPSRDGKTRTLSEGCGGMMRVAPVGWMSALGLVDNAYMLGCKSAAVTHGAEIAQRASGALAVLISELSQEKTWDQACSAVFYSLSQDPLAAKTYALGQAALKAGTALGNKISFQDIDSLPLALGAASSDKRSLFLAPAVWVQALAISSASQEWPGTDTENMRRALTLAVTQSGDSDSVGAIVGNIMGAHLGLKAVPGEWVSQLQSLPFLQKLASDLKSFSSESPQAKPFGPVRAEIRL